MTPRPRGCRGIGIQDRGRALGEVNAIYSAACEDLDDGATKEEADRLYDQCLAEARRMIADPDYMDFGMKIPGFWKSLTG
jgi:hypothetical protein